MDLGNRLTLTRRALMAGAAAAGAALAMPTGVRAAETRKLRLLLDWYINPNHAPLLVAQEIGAFAANGLEVEIIEPADPNDPPKLVAAGQGDIAISYQPQLMMQLDQGLPLARIGVLVDTPLNMLLALGGGAIKTLADLKGKKIGYSVGGFEDALLTTMLATAGLTLKDVELVNVNFALAQSLLSGAADAVIGAYRNYELNILAIEGKTPLPFFVEEYGVPAYDELIFIAAKDRAAQPANAAFLNAVQAGIAFTMNKPDEAWQLFIKGRAQLDDELNKRAFQDTLRRFSHTPAAADAVRYERFGAYLQSLGLIKEARPVTDYLVRPGA
ncbi:Putative thiamine biosynthesis protein [Alphaproteobacteria bacterium SO-S41]|nr:Putative thiamine biosynthesis protein [Alphaproteobacteria bacterium SO-S41]